MKSQALAQCGIIKGGHCTKSVLCIIGHQYFWDDMLKFDMIYLQMVVFILLKKPKRQRLITINSCSVLFQCIISRL